MRLLEKKGKPSTVSAERWSTMSKTEKWQVMGQASKELSGIYCFFGHPHEIIYDHVDFPETMTVLFDKLSGLVESFVETKTIFPASFANDVENKLFGYLSKSVY